MRYCLGGLAGLMLLAGSTGCSGLNTIQQTDYAHMKANGLAVEEKSPTCAAALGVLPGGGSFYTRQYVLGVVDVLLWPMSIAWDPIIAYNQAKVINYEVSLANAKRAKSQELLELERQLDEKQITQDEFNRQRRQLEAALNYQ